MLIGVLIMSVLVIAVGVLLLSAPKPEEEVIPPEMEETAEPPGGDEDEIVTVPGINPVSPPVTENTKEDDDVTIDPPGGGPAVQSVQITYANKQTSDFTVKTGESVVLRVRIDPVGTEEEIIWTSSNRNVFEVVATNAEATQAKVTGIGKGKATLTVAVGGVEAECIVRGR